MALGFGKAPKAEASKIANSGFGDLHLFEGQSAIQTFASSPIVSMGALRLFESKKPLSALASSPIISMGALRLFESQSKLASSPKVSMGALRLFESLPGLTSINASSGNLRLFESQPSLRGQSITSGIGTLNPVKSQSSSLNSSTAQATGIAALRRFEAGVILAANGIKSLGSYRGLAVYAASRHRNKVNEFFK